MVPNEIVLSSPEPAWPVHALAHGESVLVERLIERFDTLPTGGWHEPPQSAMLLPLHDQLRAQRPYGFLIVGLNPYRPLDDGYRSFLSLVAAQLASGIASTRAFEAERRRADELSQLDRAKTAFFTNVSHELRTPLTLMLGPTEDALADRTDRLTEGQRARLEVVARNGERLQKLVNTLLDFSRLESGNANGSFEPVDLARYTAELAEMFEPAVTRAGLAFVLDCRPLDEAVWIDREMWAKIVLNLLSNALKFTHEGSITVTVERRDGLARLSVSDTGVGIDAGEQARLFERFHRILGARARTHEGSGIGLALVAELAVVHGGTTSVSSIPGEGSTFFVEIPFGNGHLPAEQLATRSDSQAIGSTVSGFVAEAERWLTPADQTASAGVGGQQEPAAPDGRPRVLVVDDNADMRDYVAGLLAADYAVQTAANGLVALELARKRPPDLVLTDVMMPQMDGFELLSALHAEFPTMHIPVVMLSARAGGEGIAEGLEAGADDYLVKPFGARELLARVRANLELDRAKRMREQLERNQAMQDQAERLALVGSWEVDLATRALRGSEQFLQMLGLSGLGLDHADLSETFERVVHPDDRERFRVTAGAAIAAGDPVGCELRMLRPSGGERWVRLHAEVVQREGIRPLLRGYVQDISQQREVEQAVAAAAAAQRVAAREHEIADELQRSMLPPDTFDFDRLEIATYYQAGVKDTRVGGDWHDAIHIGAGRTALVIGDVTGRGITAASSMGRMRAAIRAYARLDLPPAEILERMDALVREGGDYQLVTCLYAVYDPAAGELVYANAGHLPPLVGAPGRSAHRLPDATEPPLGAEGGGYTEHRVPVTSGSLFVLYTDGLVERRGVSLDARIDALAALINPEAQSTEALPRVLVNALSPEGGEDDIAILVARVADDPAYRAETIELPDANEAVRRGRRFTSELLARWQIPEPIHDDAVLITSELVTNAVVHGRAPIRLRLRTTRRELAIEVEDGSSAIPHKLRPAPEDLHGRGLAIVDQVAESWAARPTGHGKTVWGALALSPKTAA